MNFTKAQLLLQSVWKQANAQGGARIDLKSKAAANKFRFDLYNAVRAIRKGEVIDPELLAAIEQCSIAVEGTEVVIGPKVSPDTLAAIEAALGPVAVPSAAPKDSAAEAQEKFLLKISGGKQAAEPAGRATPYYKREG